MPKPRIEPAAGLKNWKSNPRTAKKVTRLPGPGQFGGNYTQEHFSGRVDGRVGGAYVDQETEDRMRKGLIVVKGIVPITLADLEVAFLKAKAAFKADPSNVKAKRAFRELGRQLSDARAEVRRNDPRRLRAKVER